MNGLNAEGFEASGIREGRQHGNEAIAEDVAFVGRVDWHPLEGALLGASVFDGNSGQDQNVDGVTVPVPDTPTTLWDMHAEFQRWGLERARARHDGAPRRRRRLTTALRAQA